MICRNLVGAIEVYQVGSRVLYAKTSDPSFAMFEDELTPEELLAIAGDITRRGTKAANLSCGESGTSARELR